MGVPVPSGRLGSCLSATLAECPSPEPERGGPLHGLKGGYVPGAWPDITATRWDAPVALGAVHAVSGLCAAPERWTAETLSPCWVPGCRGPLPAGWPPYSQAQHLTRSRGPRARGLKLSQLVFIKGKFINSVCRAFILLVE